MRSADGSVNSEFKFFQGEEDISYREGLIGVRMPVLGRGGLSKSVTEEWEKSGESAPIIVS